MTHYNSWPLGNLPESWQRTEPSEIKALGRKWSDPRDIIDLFETEICGYVGSPRSVLTDCCTNAIFLSLRYKIENGTIHPGDTIQIPKHTYASVPMAILHAGLRFKFDDRKWSGEYELGETGVFDSAARFTSDMFVDDGRVQCLSFQIKKRLPIGRGGAVLTSDLELADWIKLSSYDGRDLRTPYDSPDHIRQLGWHMYMIPEDAARGLILLERLDRDNPDTMSWVNYPDLTKWKAINDFADS